MHRIEGLLLLLLLCTAQRQRTTKLPFGTSAPQNLFSRAREGHKKQAPATRSRPFPTGLEHASTPVSLARAPHQLGDVLTVIGRRVVTAPANKLARAARVAARRARGT